MSLSITLGSMNEVMKAVQVDEILRINEESQKYGLRLTPSEAEEIISTRNDVLQNIGRVELSMDVIKKLIQSFCASSFINQEEYASTLNELQEIFYYMKNEMEDCVGDDELIEMMKDYFENHCYGSLELLEGRELENFARNLRRSNQMDEFLAEGEDDYDF